MQTTLVYGIGINDANYSVTEGVGRNRIKCPFYRSWTGILERGYSGKWKQRYPAYVDCSVVEEWHLFSTFRRWMEKQNWEGKHLDKDILFPGNKVYSPETCVFIDQRLNKFFTEKSIDGRTLPVGVSIHNTTGRFIACCHNTPYKEYLGVFGTPQEAHQAWLTRKLELAKLLAAEQDDPRVAKALIDRYENYGRGYV